MADNGRLQALQPAHASNHLNFGHFGTATYDVDSKSWSFLRQDFNNFQRSGQPYANTSFFKLIRQPTLVLEGNTKSCLSETQSSFNPHQHFLRVVPEIAAGAYSHRRHDKSDHERLGPTEPIADLLSFGSALILGSNDVQSGIQTIPVAAFVNSSDTNRLLLMLMDSETVSSHEDISKRYELACFSKTSSVTWQSNDGTINQIQFCARNRPHDATWLAVRQLNGVTVLRPILHRTRAISSRQSALEPQFVVTIPSSRTGGMLQADMAFHPEDPHQLAIIDIAGNLSIWRIKGSRSRTTRVLYGAQLTLQASFSSQADETQQFDGWHKILWLSTGGQGIDCILVANRSSVGLFDLNGSVLFQADMRIGSRTCEWLLDVVPAFSPTDFFVLTASQIIILTTQSGSFSETDRNQTHVISVVASWNHTRAAIDHTLRLQIMRIGNVAWLFLTSSAFGPTIVYRCSKIVSSARPHYAVFDPLWFNFPSEVNEHHQHLAIQPVASQLSSSRRTSGATNLFKVFLKDENSAVYEVLYQLCDAANSTFLASDATPVPKPELVKHKSSYHIADDNSEDDMYDFIVADDDDENNDNLTPHKLHNLILQGFDETPVGPANTSNSRVLDMQRIRQSVTTSWQPVNIEIGFEVDSMLNVMEDRLEGSSKAQTLQNLLTGSSPDLAYPTDIENDSQTLETWLEQMAISVNENEGASRYEVKRIREPGALIEMYDDIADDWVLSLPNTLPDRSRVQAERLSRHVALDLYLSSTIVKPATKTPDTDSGPVEHDLDEANSTQLDTGPHSDPSPASISPSRPSEPSTSHLEDKFPTLKMYANFTKPPSEPSNNRTATNRILAHLPQSSDIDPNTYNYNEIETNLSLEANDLAYQNLDSKARRRAGKLARSQKKQFDKQAQIKRVAFEQATALPTVSSSQLPIRAVQSSQAGPPFSSQLSVNSGPRLNMTQPERGVFGQREAGSSKQRAKPGRQKGF